MSRVNYDEGLTVDIIVNDIILNDYYNSLCRVKLVILLVLLKSYLFLTVEFEPVGVKKELRTEIADISNLLETIRFLIDSEGIKVKILIQ